MNIVYIQTPKRYNENENDDGGWRKDFGFPGRVGASGVGGTQTPNIYNVLF